MEEKNVKHLHQIDLVPFVPASCYRCSLDSVELTLQLIDFMCTASKPSSFNYLVNSYTITQSINILNKGDAKWKKSVSLFNYSFPSISLT